MVSNVLELVKYIKELISVPHPLVSMFVMDGTNYLQGARFKLINELGTIFIVEIKDSQNMLNPNARDFTNLPRIWKKDEIITFSLKESIHTIPNTLNIIIVVRDEHNRYFNCHITKETTICVKISVDWKKSLLKL